MCKGGGDRIDFRSTTRKKPKSELPSVTAPIPLSLEEKCAATLGKASKPWFYFFLGSCTCNVCLWRKTRLPESCE